MATSKPKLQGYVAQQLFDQFENERREWGLTQSQALEKILAERYGVEQEQRSLSLDWQNYTTEAVTKLVDRIVRLEELTSNSLTSSVSELERITSDIDKKIESEITARLDYGLLEVRETLLSKLDTMLDVKLAELLTPHITKIEELASKLDSKLADSDRSTSPQITSDTPQDKADWVICKAHKIKRDRLSYFAGLQVGFVDNLNLAKIYKDSATAQMCGRIQKSPRHEPADDEYLILKDFEELKAAIATTQIQEGD